MRLATIATCSMLVAAGCDEPRAPTKTTDTAASAAATSSATSSASAAPADPGALQLPANATFGDLVKLARDAKRGAARPSCILRGTGAFEALLTPKEKLADPPADLDPIVSTVVKGDLDRGARVIATWGATHGGGFLDLVALSPVPRAIKSGVTLVLAVTDQGNFVAILGQGGFQALPESDHDRLRNEVLPRSPAIVITAEAKTPLTKLREVLALVDGAAGSVVLATPRAAAEPPSHTPPSRYDARVEEGAPQACDARLKGGASGAEAGEYSMSQMGAVGDVFNKAVASCISASPAADGTIHVLMRIKADGAVESACAETDDAGDLAARKCVVDAVKAAHFPKPNKPGIIAFGSEAIFKGSRVRALCDP